MPKPSLCVILVIFVLLGCSGSTQKKPADEQAARIDKKNPAKLPLKPDTALVCADGPEAKAFDPDKEVFDDYVKQHKEYVKGTTKLSDDYINDHLFGGVDSVVVRNTWSYEEVNRVSVSEYISENEFYLVGAVLKRPLFTGIIYEVISGEGAEKYFSTFDNTGNFIARIILAGYFQKGFYLDDRSERHPYFVKMTGCINGDLTIDRGCEPVPEIAKCKIEPDGHIVKI